MREPCQACKRGFHNRCFSFCDCCRPKPVALICGITENGIPCGRPAQRYVMGDIGEQVACSGHRLRFLMILGTLWKKEQEELKKNA
jgi:hypothetical protein